MTRLRIDAIAEKHMATTPFPHLVVADMWEGYAGLIAALPESFYYDPMQRNPETGHVTRSHCHLDALPESPVWVALNEKLHSRNLWTLMSERFSLVDAPPESDLIVDVRLFRDEPGYTLAPHTDAQSKIITLIFYLAEDDSHPEWGTRILADSVDMNGTLIPYVPNVMFAFARSSKSWHASGPIQGVRNTLQVIYRTHRTGKE